MSDPARTSSRAAALTIVGLLAGAAAFLQRSPADSRESALPVLRAVQQQEKGIERAAAAALPLSPEEERALGEELESRLAPPILEPALQGLVRELGAQAARSPIVSRFRGRYSFVVDDSAAVNAFALPGGFIHVHNGLAQRLRADEPALLFVLGHEIAHVELGHCADGHRARAWRRLIGPAADLAGLARAFAALHFSEVQELEADAYAVRLLASIGRDPAAGLRAMDALGLTDPPDGARRSPDGAALEALADYFKTHPGAWERRATLRREISKAAR